MPRPSASTHLRPRPLPVRSARVRRFPLPQLPNDSPVKAQLDRVLSSRSFRNARRSQLFLRYILHHALAHPNEPLKEYSIALDVFDRDTSYDPAINNTVRVEAGRLRSRLLEYYAGEGQSDPLLFEVPKGSYRVLIRDHHAEHRAIPAPSLRSGLRHLWAVPLAFLLGALIGRRASH